MAWSRIDSLLIISGAFGFFDREIALAVGGYTPPTYHTNTEEWTVPFATKTIGTD